MIIDGYTHYRGINCEASVIRNVLKYYSSEYSEELIFGLDSSIGFMYFKAKNDQPDVALGKSEIFTKKSLNYLGVKCQGSSSLTGDAGWKKIKEDYLNKSIPVIARVDNAFLPYWNLPEEANFGGYFIVICGYNEENDTVYISDSEFDEIQQVTLKELSLARSSKKSPPVNPDNQIFILEPVTRNPDISKIGIVAVKQVVRNFLISPTGNTGLKGMSKFCNAMEDWSKSKVGTITEIYRDGTQIELPTLVFQMKQVGRYINGIGTGRGCYRYIFSQYLKDLYEITDRSELNDSFELLKESADIWDEIGCSFSDGIDQLQCEEAKDILDSAIEKCTKIIHTEKKAFDILKKL